MGYPVGSSPINAANGATFAKTDYAANAGSNILTPPGTADQGPSSTACLTSYPSCGSLDSNWNVSAADNGVSNHRSEVKPASITDGAANTLFAAEKYMDPKQYNTGAGCSDGLAAYVGCDSNVNRLVPGISVPAGAPPTPANVTLSNTAATQPMLDTPGVDGNPDLCFGSAHASGLNAVFCDGAVKTISYTIDLKVWAGMGIRNDHVAFGDTF